MERVTETEHATFTPLVFGTNGGMVRECALFIKIWQWNLQKKRTNNIQMLSLPLEQNYPFVS